jgi:Ran GTPase-activating protein (RanGAP) involved in mRNA processing and transport
MSVSNDSTGTIDNGRALLSSTFLDFCVKVRNNDPSILQELGKPFKIRCVCERERIELADALLENTSVTYLELARGKCTKRFAEAIAKYVRTSTRLQHICWNRDWDSVIDDREVVLRQREEMFSCFLPAIQGSTSLKELHMELHPRGGPSNLAFENMLTHTQTLRSLSLRIPPRQIDAAAVSSGLKKNTTLREFTLNVSRGATTVSLILTGLRDHPLLRRLCLHEHVVNLSGLETLLLSDNSQITELEIDRLYGSLPLIGLTLALQALARRPTLTRLRLRCCPLGRKEAKLLRLALCKIPSLQSLVLTDGTLGRAALEELAPALCHNMSIEVLDLSSNSLDDMESANILRDILFSNKTLTALNLSANTFGNMPGAVDCIADEMGSNPALLKIDLSYCALKDAGVSILAKALGLKNATLQKLTLDNNSITSMGFGVLLGTIEQNSHHITDLELQRNSIGNAGACLLARSLGNNALPNLKRLSLSYCNVGGYGFIALVSALEQNTSLLQLNLRTHNGFSERAFLTLADSLSKNKVLQRVDLTWCRDLASAMPLLLVGLRKNTSLLRFDVVDYAPSVVPPTGESTARCTGGWMQEMERLGYRNRFLPLIREPKERLPPRGVWTRALARAALFPDVIFEVLRSKPNLVPSTDTGAGVKEVVEDTGVPKKRDE